MFNKIKKKYFKQNIDKTNCTFEYCKQKSFKTNVNKYKKPEIDPL